MLVLSGRLLHLLLMELLTASKLKKKKMLAQWKCVIDWGHKVKYIPAVPET